MKRFFVGIIAVITVLAVMGTSALAAGGLNWHYDAASCGIRIGSGCHHYRTEAAAVPDVSEAVYVEAACPGWVDNDGDGVCDNYGSGNCSGHHGGGNGTGAGWVDGNGDGVCDNYGSGNGAGSGSGSGGGGHHGGGHHSGGHHNW